jgi:hypothetical protein
MLRRLCDQSLSVIPVTKDNKGCSKITTRHKISKTKNTKEWQMLSAFVLFTAALRRREGISYGKDQH